MIGDLVIFGNAIFDSVKDEPFEGGIVVKDDKIAFVGSREEAQKWVGPDTVVKEYHDNLIMPGLCDSHGHFSSGARSYALNHCDLSTGNSEEECAQLMADFVNENRGDDKFYIGMGWNMSYWGKDPQLPTNKSLDALIPDVPVFLIPSDLHSLWMNTAGMKYVDLESFYEDFDEDLIPRDENGKPAGLLKEGIGNLTCEKVMSYSPEEVAGFQKKFMDALTAEGITGFSDVNFVPPDGLANGYRQLKSFENNEELTLRIYVYPGNAPLMIPSEIDKIPPYEEFFNTDMLRIAGVKGIVDGVTSSFTALMTEPYHDKPDTCGQQGVSYELMRDWVIKENSMGYSTRIHCIGDLAVRLALDAYEESSKVNDVWKLHNAIEHIEIIKPEDIPRFAKLNVTASMQPGHQMKDKGIKLQRCGRERCRYEWAFRSLKDAGTHIAFGTDYTAMDFKPFPNIYYSLTIRDLDGTQYGEMSRDEVLTLPEALKAYTVEGALLNGMIDKVGTLEAGKYADIIVTDRNLFDIPVDDIKDVKNILTVFNGKVVYER